MEYPPPYTRPRLRCGIQSLRRSCASAERAQWCRSNGAEWEAGTRLGSLARENLYDIVSRLPRTVVGFLLFHAGRPGGYLQCNPVGHTRLLKAVLHLARSRHPIKKPSLVASIAKLICDLAVLEMARVGKLVEHEAVRSLCFCVRSRLTGVQRRRQVLFSYKNPANLSST